ncbi:hypothetical protein EDC01DRAFT_777009 [Geopyxis carbonaria]|nr:hypothetical protein EDC01DRAFT_777009 [Geopyxis carbonaria]
MPTERGRKWSEVPPTWTAETGLRVSITGAGAGATIVASASLSRALGRANRARASEIYIPSWASGRLAGHCAVWGPDALSIDRGGVGPTEATCIRNPND